MSYIERVYHYFFMPSRLDVYEEVLKHAIKRNYEMHSIASFLKLINENKIDSRSKYFINRHDIDSNINTAKEMFEIEQKLQVKSSYYFRLSTLNIEFMKLIDSYGSEASYHYEEIATYAKKHNLVNKTAVDNEMQNIQNLFKNNLKTLRYKTNLPMKTIASHGDFANRKIGMPNHMLLNDKLREEMEIELETYDEKMMNFVQCRIADSMWPKYFQKNMSPFVAVDEQTSVIYLLTHPGNWRSSKIESIKHLMIRAFEGVRFRLKVGNLKL